VKKSFAFPRLWKTSRLNVTLTKRPHPSSKLQTLCWIKVAATGERHARWADPILCISGSTLIFTAKQAL
jgi:hypothetical protein